MISVNGFIIRPIDDEQGPWTVETEDGRAICEDGQPVEFDSRESAEAWAMVASAKMVAEP